MIFVPQSCRRRPGRVILRIHPGNGVTRRIVLTFNELHDNCRLWPVPIEVNAGTNKSLTPVSSATAFS